jgi:thioredoxin 1
MEEFLKILFFVVAFIVLLRLGLKLYVLNKAKAMKGVEVELIKDGVLYFYSQRCGACKAMEPQVERLSKELEVKRIDVFSEEGQRVAKSLGVMATPTTLVVKDGKVQESFVGIVSADRILQEFKP